MENDLFKEQEKQDQLQLKTTSEYTNDEKSLDQSVRNEEDETADGRTELEDVEKIV